jgi:hypothetical protein
MNVNHVGLQTYFQTFRFFWHYAEKSTKNKEFYLLLIPIIFKNFMKISISRFNMTMH